MKLRKLRGANTWTLTNETEGWTMVLRYEWRSPYASVEVDGEVFDLDYLDWDDDWVDDHGVTLVPGPGRLQLPDGRTFVVPVNDRLAVMRAVWPEYVWAAATEEQLEMLRFHKLFFDALRLDLLVGRLLGRDETELDIEQSANLAAYSEAVAAFEEASGFGPGGFRMTVELFDAENPSEDNLFDLEFFRRAFNKAQAIFATPGTGSVET